MQDMNSQNLAYEYSEYETEKSENENNNSEQSEKKPAPPKSSGRRTASVIRYFTVSVAALALLCFMIYGRVELSSLYTQQSELESKLTRLQSENVALETELAQKNGLTQAESYAENQLGLKKLEKYQIEYVEVPKPDVAEAAAPEDDNIFVRIKKWFLGVLEYIGAQ